MTFMILGAMIITTETIAAATLRPGQSQKALVQKSSKKDDDDDEVKGISISKTFEYSGSGNINVGDIMEKALSGELEVEKDEKPKKKRRRGNKKNSSKKRC